MDDYTILTYGDEYIEPLPDVNENNYMGYDDTIETDKDYEQYVAPVLPQEDPQQQIINENDSTVNDVLQKIITDALTNRDIQQTENVETDESENLNEVNSNENDNSDITTVDYIPYFNNIISAISDTDSTDYLQAIQATQAQQIEYNNINASLADQNATNTLLLVIIVLMFGKISIDFIRGLL